MKPDWPTLAAWSVTFLLIGASLFGAWMMTGENVDGMIALFERLEDRSVQRPFSTTLVFAAIFAFTTALTLPTATILCVCSGYLFGTLTGTVVSMTGAMGGAVLTFVTVRFLAGERVRNFLLRGRTQRLVELLERDAFFYLVTFRIVPVAPFFAINAAGALIRISARRYLLATAVGLLPITLVYASVGAGLDTLIEAGDVRGPAVLLEPRVLLPLVAVIIVVGAGLATRRAVRRRRQRRA